MIQRGPWVTLLPSAVFTPNDFPILWYCVSKHSAAAAAVLPHPGWVSQELGKVENMLVILREWPPGDSTCNLRRRISSSVCYHDSNEEDVLAEMMVFEVRPPSCCILCIINTSLSLYNSRVSNVGITELISVVVAGWVQQYANYSGIPTSKAHMWDCGAGACGMGVFLLQLRQSCQKLDLSFLWGEVLRKYFLNPV